MILGFQLSGRRVCVCNKVELNLDRIAYFIERHVVRHSEIAPVEGKISIDCLMALFLRVYDYSDGHKLGDPAHGEICIHEEFGRIRPAVRRDAF